MSLVALGRAGAIVSSAGVAFMVVFVITLLAFPVIKYCNEGGAKCSYRSTAPAQLQSVVQPAFLAISLLTISGGILLLRLARWLESKRYEKAF